MPVPKKKRTTSTPDPSTSEQSLPMLPEQQDFHQHLRTLARRAIRVVIEELMREELDQFIGAAWGECSPKRNGSYTRDQDRGSGPNADGSGSSCQRDQSPQPEPYPPI